MAATKATRGTAKERPINQSCWLNWIEVDTHWPAWSPS